MNGLSVMFIIGKPIWPKFEVVSTHLRLVVGPFSLWIILRDMEVFFSYVQTLKEKADANVS